MNRNRATQNSCDSHDLRTNCTAMLGVHQLKAKSPEDHFDNQLGRLPVLDCIIPYTHRDDAPMSARHNTAKTSHRRARCARVRRTPRASRGAARRVAALQNARHVSHAARARASPAGHARSLRGRHRVPRRPRRRAYDRRANFYFISSRLSFIHARNNEKITNRRPRVASLSRPPPRRPPPGPARPPVRAWGAFAGIDWARGGWRLFARGRSRARMTQCTRGGARWKCARKYRAFQV